MRAKLSDHTLWSEIKRKKDTSVVMAAKNWPSNAHLIYDVSRLGYLRYEWRTLDPTYGEGVWWQIFRPHELIIHDKFKLDGVDFRNLPHEDEEFQAVAFDPPFKLTGTDYVEGSRFGNDRPMTWQAKMQMIRDGITECERVLKPYGILLLKCQDQVAWGEIRWQTIEFVNHAHAVGLDLEDKFDYYGGYRPQPNDGRKQQHARGRGSTLLVFRKPKRRRNGER